jgi:MipA family protein
MRRGVTELRVLEIRRAIGFAAILFFVGFSATAQAGKESHEHARMVPREAKPLFEVRAVLAGAYLPDYPASGQSHLSGLALPFFAYRGKILRSDEKGVLRGRLVKTDRLEFDLSFDGAFSSDSRKNDARRGMPDLDWMGEVGPRIQWTIAKAAHSAKVDINLPVRAVFSTDLSRIDSRGYVFEPEIAYQHENFLRQNLAVRVSAGIAFASEDLMDYFYEVEPRFVVAGRAAFDAKGGYLGAKTELSLVKALGARLNFMLAFRADFHGGAENISSPLFKEEATFGTTAALVWSLYQSAAREKP